MHLGALTPSPVLMANQARQQAALAKAAKLGILVGGVYDPAVAVRARAEGKITAAELQEIANYRRALASLSRRGQTSGPGSAQSVPTPAAAPAPAPAPVQNTLAPGPRVLLDEAEYSARRGALERELTAAKARVATPTMVTAGAPPIADAAAFAASAPATAEAPGAPGWVLPAAIGGGALLVLLMLGGR